jgi:hypothetical protein
MDDTVLIPDVYGAYYNVYEETCRRKGVLGKAEQV